MGSGAARPSGGEARNTGNKLSTMSEYLTLLIYVNSSGDIANFINKYGEH